MHNYGKNLLLLMQIEQNILLWGVLQVLLYVCCLAVKRETAPTPPPAPSKPALTEEELEKKSTAIIEEYLHINDMKVHTHTHTHTPLSWSGLCVTSPSAAVAPPLLQEALQCVAELSCSSLLSVFVRTGMESMLERSTITREHLGLLFHQLVKTQTLSTQQYYKGWDTSSLCVCVCVLLEFLLIFSVRFISLFIFAVLLSF